MCNHNYDIHPLFGSITWVRNAQTQQVQPSQQGATPTSNHPCLSRYDRKENELCHQNLPNHVPTTQHLLVREAYFNDVLLYNDNTIRLSYRG